MRLISVLIILAIVGLVVFWVYGNKTNEMSESEQVEVSEPNNGYIDKMFDGLNQAKELNKKSYENVE